MPLEYEDVGVMGVNAQSPVGGTVIPRARDETFAPTKQPSTGGATTFVSKPRMSRDADDDVNADIHVAPRLGATGRKGGVVTPRMRSDINDSGVTNVDIDDAGQEVMEFAAFSSPRLGATGRSDINDSGVPNVDIDGAGQEAVELAAFSSPRLGATGRSDINDSGVPNSDMDDAGQEVVERAAFSKPRLGATARSNITSRLRSNVSDDGVNETDYILSTPPTSFALTPETMACTNDTLVCEPPYSICVGNECMPRPCWANSWETPQPDWWTDLLGCWPVDMGLTVELLSCHMPGDDAPAEMSMDDSIAVGDPPGSCLPLACDPAEELLPLSQQTATPPYTACMRSSDFFDGDESVVTTSALSSGRFARYSNAIYTQLSPEKYYVFPAKCEMGCNVTCHTPETTCMGVESKITGRLDSSSACGCSANERKKSPGCVCLG